MANPASLADARKGGRVARAAAMICRDLQFQRWLDRKRSVVAGTHDESLTREWLIAACKVSSRAELDHDREGALMFRRIVIAFQRDNSPPRPIGDPKRLALELPAILDSEEWLFLIALTMNWLFRNDVVGVLR
jgi:hypothetical protein